MAADARALFLLALITAWSLGSIVTIIVKIKDIAEELAKRAEEKHVLERLLRATARYITEVGNILVDWLFTDNTTSTHYNRTGINITSIIGDEVTKIINKTISDQSLQQPYCPNVEDTTTRTPCNSNEEGTNTINAGNRVKIVQAPTLK